MNNDIIIYYTLYRYRPRVALFRTQTVLSRAAMHYNPLSVPLLSVEGNFYTSVTDGVTTLADFENDDIMCNLRWTSFAGSKPSVYQTSLDIMAPALNILSLTLHINNI